MIKTISDIYNEFYQLFVSGGMPRGISTGWPSLDPFYTIRRGEFTLVTGIPGHGKSSWLDNVMIQTAVDHDWKWLVFSAENQPAARHAANLSAIYIGRPFNPSSRQRMSQEDWLYAGGFLDTQIRFMEPVPHECNINDILARAYYEQFHAMVIDPWNELDHARPATMTETEYISECLSKIRRFARDKNVAVFVVAHPTKLIRVKSGEDANAYPVPTPYDVSGSSHWRNKSDNCICVWRDVTSPLKDTHIHVQKIRFREVGNVGVCKLYYDRETGRYIDPLTGDRPAFAVQKYRDDMDARIQAHEEELAKLTLELEAVQAARQKFDSGR